MGAPRRKGGLGARRRPGDEGEEDGSIVGPDDSLSEPSVPSDVDDDADGEGSDEDELESQGRQTNGKHSLRNGHKSDGTVSEKPVHFDTETADTSHMLNGLTIADGSEEIEEIHFGTALDGSADATPGVTRLSEPSDRPESLAEKRRREHEEYKKRRNADPAFVPNRGGFYMHDERSANGAQINNGHKPAPRGRGRGRGGYFNHGDHHAAQPESAPWTHDLHETLHDGGRGRVESSQTAADTAPDHQVPPTVQPISNPPPNRTFSSTVQTGNYQIRVFLPGMPDPIVFSAVPCRQHTRLPHHRPPLRRDKPVRISLPDTPVHYIFPAADRSFIFIPRALRPNQQGFHRGRGRGSIGGPGGLRSGRNSIYGGSTYSPSVAMSRRSSFARERDGMISPALSVMSRATGPIVRFPHGGTPNQGPTPVHFGQQMPHKPMNAMTFPQPTSYSNIPMHQPRPQKAVAVADIEPGVQGFHGGQQIPQPFAHQVPPHYADPNAGRRTSYPSQRGTPLSNIPERAIHAQPFQPYPPQPYGQSMTQQMPPPPLPTSQHPGFPPQAHPQQMYYPQQPYPQNMYYYPQGPLPQDASAPQPAYNPYMAPAQPPAPAGPEATSQPGMVAHASNGMVFYYDQSQMPVEQAPQPAPMQYAQGPFEGMAPGYMMPTQGTVYYPPPPA